MEKDLRDLENQIARKAKTGRQRSWII